MKLSLRIPRAGIALGLLWGPALGSGCATVGPGALPAIIDSGEVANAAGPPHIRRIRDQGNVRLPERGTWSGDGDGVAVPGELLLIEGDDLGKQPTVTVGGRSAEVIARTDGGGVMVRVPTGAPTGEVAVQVAQPRGKATQSFSLRRLALVVHDGQVWSLAVDKQAARAIARPLALPGASRVALNGDGSVAYVLAAGAPREAAAPRDAEHVNVDRLAVLDLAAAGGPRVVRERALTHRATLLSTALDAPVAALVGDGRLTLVRTTRPLEPALWEAVDLPKEARAPRAIELSPDGKLLAILLHDSNRLVALDVADPAAPKLLTVIDLLPNERAPLVRDLAFTPDGGILWVVSGDSVEGARTQPSQPMRLTAVRIMTRGAADSEANAAGPALPEGARLLTLWRTQSVPGAAAPLRLTAARGQPLASGAAVRRPPDKAALFVTSVNAALIKLADLDLSAAAGVEAARKLWHPPPAIMVRADVDGHGGPMFASADLVSAVDLTPDAQLLVATAARLGSGAGGATLDFGVTVTPVWGATTPRFVPLGHLAVAQLRPPFRFGDLRIQP